MRISSHLHDWNIRKGDVVALWMEKSPEYIESILAIWNLGGIFLPLDAKTPAARVEWICKDANVKILLTNNLLQCSFCNNLDIPSLLTKKNSTFSQNTTLVIDSPNVQSNDIAYIIYTSGSTGNPKGVIVAHAGISNFLQKQIEVFQVTPQSKILQYLSIAFDASLSEIGISLLSGAEIYIASEKNLKQIESLIDIIKEKRITHICLPPSLLTFLPIEKIPSCLKTIIIGGEVCPVDTVRLWASRFHLVNVYGPTEATVCTSLIVCGANWTKPLIGLPIPNMNFHILNEELQPTEDDEPGELYLSGIGIALGYLNQEKMTQERFILVNKMRLYKTCDRVVRHSSGEVEFLGRIDRQFKLNGNLIEPMEVELALSYHPTISLVYVNKQKVMRDVLVAYIVLKRSIHPDEKYLLSLRNYLSKFLPRWMIPERFIILEKFPLNANEKLDFSALPKLDSTRPNYLPFFEKPETDLEVKLCLVFEKLLSIKPIGVNDDFFILGGDSLSMISLLTECRLLGINLSPEKFIQNPSISGILKINHFENIQTKKVSFLNQEASLDEEMKEAITNNPHTNKKITKILLTGATGFLGSRILYEINQNTKIEIYCVIRNIAIRDPYKILADIYFKQNITFRDWSCIHFLEGDISQPNLGLSIVNWKFLVNNIDSVFHFAAEVNLLAPYEFLKPSNINSTREILKLCNLGKRKSIHYASTLSVFVSSNDPRDVFFESDTLNTMTEVYGGYAQTKWVSEKMLLNAKLSGMESIYIYRFGLITGDSNSGYGKKNDLFSIFIKSIINMKTLPTSGIKELAVDITPLDYAANACSAIALSRLNDEKHVFHIAGKNPLYLSDLIRILNELGITIAMIPKEEFVNKCKTFGLENSYLYLSLSRILTSFDAFTLIRPLDLFQATGIRFDFHNTESILSNYKIYCPAPNKELLRKYINNLEFL